MALPRPFPPVLLQVALLLGCSSSEAGPAVQPDAAVSPEEDSGTSPPADAAVAIPTSGGSGGLTCTQNDALRDGRAVCIAKIGSVELKIAVAKGGSGPLRLGLYLHGDGAAAHKSKSVLEAMTAWADAQHGLAVSALAPNGCAWWQTPAHDCASSKREPDLAGENAAALVTALEAIMKAYDVRTDGLRYYGSSGGSIFLTDEWIPLHGGKYPGVFALMCGGEASPRTYGWDATDTELRGKSPLWFTYGDQDFLLTDIEASVSAFKRKKFAVTEKVIPGAAHCAFDAHGEAIGIWTANP